MVKIRRVNGELIGTGVTFALAAVANPNNLWQADLRAVYLRGVHLCQAYLRQANLRGADLRGANLAQADLGEANLWGADLTQADLTQADLRGANLRGAYLRGADLAGAHYSLLSVLESHWSFLPLDLALELMRWDALACGEEAMSSWAAAAGSGWCPFRAQPREFLFAERHDLWRPGPPTMNYVQLFVALCEATGIRQDRF